MPIVRMIFVKVVPEQAKKAEQSWKESCAPLMIQHPGCLSEKLLRSSDDPGEFISYSEGKDQDSIDAYRISEAYQKIKHARHLYGDRPSVKRTNSLVNWVRSKANTRWPTDGCAPY